MITYFIIGFSLYFVGLFPMLGYFFAYEHFMEFTALSSNPEAVKYAKYFNSLVIIPYFLLILPKFSHSIASKMAFQELSFKESFQLTITEARMLLCFLPVIGHYFLPNENSDQN